MGSIGENGPGEGVGSVMSKGEIVGLLGGP